MSNAGDPLGVDIFATNGFPLRMRLSYGQENIQAASLRRLSCDEGVLASIGDDPDYGYNLASHLNEEFNPGGMAVSALAFRQNCSRIRASRPCRPRLPSAQAVCRFPATGRPRRGRFHLWRM